jgi:hypothetical protein
MVSVSRDGCVKSLTNNYGAEIREDEVKKRVVRV